MPRDEIELKFKIAEPEALRGRVRGLGFRVAVPRRRESNWIFDDAGGRLQAAGLVLRLRHSGTGWLLTVKGPRRPGALKRRREAETRIADGAEGRELLELLGYREALRYDRHRTSLRRPRQPGELAWDETPMGLYCEIEGTAAWVRRTARELGLKVADAEPRSYPAIYAAWRQRKR